MLKIDIYLTLQSVNLIKVFLLVRPIYIERYLI